MQIKKLFLSLLKWLLILVFGLSGWIALIAFVVIQGFSEGGYKEGLPLGDLNSDDEFWGYGFEGEIPQLLTKGSLIVEARYGLKDVAFIGLINLDKKSTEELLNKSFNNVDINPDYSLFYEKIICQGGADLTLYWGIDSNGLGDYFNFCSILAGERTAQWKSIERQTVEEDGVGFTYMNINHLVGTNYFSISHGKS